MGGIGVDQAWVLRSARRHCPNPALRTAAAFAKGGNGEAPVHRSQVTRWENGTYSPWFGLVRRYETVCGYPNGRLIAAIDILNRQRNPVSPAPVLRRPAPDDYLSATTDLLEAALTGAPLSGEDWDILTAVLGDLPAVLLMPEQWRQLLSRGLRELSVSTRLAYLQRFEALARLAGHPSARRHLVAEFEHTLSDPESQVYSETAALMQFCDDPDAQPALLRIVADPVNLNALRAGLYATAALLRQRRLEPEYAVQAAQLAFDYCLDADLPYRVRRSGADVLRALTPSARRRLARRLSRGSMTEFLTSILYEGEPRPAQQTKALRKRIRATVQDQLHASLDDDPGLSRLLEYVMTETNDQRRADALELLMVLPFGSLVGNAYAAELQLSLDRRDIDAVHESLGVLSFLGTPASSGLLKDLAMLAHPLGGRADQVATEAAWALGNLPGRAPKMDIIEAGVAAAVRRCLHGAGSAKDSLYEAWAYCLGMRGRQDLLHELHPPQPSQRFAAWSAARRWWLDIPQYLVAGNA